MSIVTKFGFGRKVPGVWARPEMDVTFIAEIMPGVAREDRTFRIQRVLRNGRVTLHNFPGEYREAAFEQLEFAISKNNPTYHS